MDSKHLYFDAISNIYNSVRPGYPNILYDKINEFGKFNFNSKLLEVGAGSGISSTEIVQYWNPKLTLIEPGIEFCKLLKSLFNAQNNIDIINSSFENFNSNNHYNAILFSSSFHWIDKAVKFKKAKDLLVSDGLLIVYSNFYNISNNFLCQEMKDIYNYYDQTIFFDSKKQQKNINELYDEIESSIFFKILYSNNFERILNYDSEKFFLLEKTFLNNIKNAQLYIDLVNLLKNHNNEIDIKVITNLVIAKKI